MVKNRDHKTRKSENIVGKVKTPLKTSLKKVPCIGVYFDSKKGANAQETFFALNLIFVKQHIFGRVTEIGPAWV